MPAKKVPDDVFMRVWEESKDAETAAQTLGMKVDTARHRATLLRKKGFPLSNKRADIDYSKLNEFIQSVIDHKAELTTRELVLLYLMRCPIKKIARVRGVRSNVVITAIRRLRAWGAKIPHRNRVNRTKENHERPLPS